MAAFESRLDDAILSQSCVARLYIAMHEGEGCARSSRFWRRTLHVHVHSFQEGCGFQVYGMYTLRAKFFS